MKTLGIWEKIFVRRIKGAKWTKFNAKFDTGAEWSRIWLKDAARLKLGPIEDTQRIRTSGGGRQLRPVVPATVRIAGRRVTVHFTVSNRKAGILIGRRTLRKRFIVDPAKKHLSTP